MSEQIYFEDYPDFKPDYTPVEMLSKGIFGKSYFNCRELRDAGFKWFNWVNPQFLRDADKHIRHSRSYMVSQENHLNNHFKVACGSTFEQWEEKGWLFDCDPYGWYNWYINFYYGRRNECDQKQIQRWKSFKLRHGNRMLKMCEPHEIDKSLKTRQNLLHWAIDSTKLKKS